jgi:hypothetical protein
MSCETCAHEHAGTVGVVSYPGDKVARVSENCGISTKDLYIHRHGGT